MNRLFAAFARRRTLHRLRRDLRHLTTLMSLPRACSYLVSESPMFTGNLALTQWRTDRVSHEAWMALDTLQRRILLHGFASVASSIDRPLELARLFVDQAKPSFEPDEFARFVKDRKIDLTGPETCALGLALRCQILLQLFTDTCHWVLERERPGGDRGPSVHILRILAAALASDELLAETLCAPTGKQSMENAISSQVAGKCDVAKHEDDAALRVDPNLIFDVGAHKGEDTKRYLRKGFRVVAIEANPYLIPALQERFATEIRTGQVQLVHAAIADADGETDFFVNRTVSIWGTTNPDWVARNAGYGTEHMRISVPALRFETVLRRHGMPHYLKVDIEGSDMKCVRALQSFSSRPSFLSLESTKTSWNGLLEEFEQLERLGYKSFRLVNQARVHEQREPDPAFEGCSSGLPLWPESSGLFGRDLRTGWVDKSDAIRRYRAVFVLYRWFGDGTWASRLVRKNVLARGLLRSFQPGWYDTHASLHEAPVLNQ